ncbi:MAG TPA: hypothetical protein VL654_03985, partial [Casimicrobiaceae bacterium]|nr:hypothetical protein [Casimicrobiaceae bacterium]
RMGDERRGAERKPGLQRLAAGETFHGLSSSRLWVTQTTLSARSIPVLPELLGGDYIVLRDISPARRRLGIGGRRACRRLLGVVRRPYARSVAHRLRGRAK